MMKVAVGGETILFLATRYPSKQRQMIPYHQPDWRVLVFAQFNFSDIPVLLVKFAFLHQLQSVCQCIVQFHPASLSGLLRCHFSRRHDATQGVDQKENDNAALPNRSTFTNVGGIDHFLNLVNVRVGKDNEATPGRLDRPQGRQTVNDTLFGGTVPQLRHVFVQKLDFVLEKSPLVLQCRAVDGILAVGHVQGRQDDFLVRHAFDVPNSRIRLT
eukprot:scaffold3014_cov172-Amphora_coffeaeformis.AAC.6